MDMDDEMAAAVFSKALSMLLEPLHGILVHTGETAVMVFRDDKGFINCSEPDSSMLEIPDGTVLPIQYHVVKDDAIDETNFVLPPTGKLN